MSKLTNQDKLSKYESCAKDSYNLGMVVSMLAQGKTAEQIEKALIEKGYKVK